MSNAVVQRKEYSNPPRVLLYALFNGNIKIPQTKLLLIGIVAEHIIAPVLRSYQLHMQESFIHTNHLQ
jgi:hypothetical protein